jgi:hypothetical protein
MNAIHKGIFSFASSDPEPAFAMPERAEGDLDFPAKVAKKSCVMRVSTVLHQVSHDSDQVMGG